jgi:hypothetical protein
MTTQYILIQENPTTVLLGGQGLKFLSASTFHFAQKSHSHIVQIFHSHPLVAEQKSCTLARISERHLACFIGFNHKKKGADSIIFVRKYTMGVSRTIKKWRQGSSEEILGVNFD